MFDSRGRECVFYEQFLSSKKYSHLVIHCLPLDKNVSNMAPIYFKVTFFLNKIFDYYITDLIKQL
jgi:hypothetical protein